MKKRLNISEKALKILDKIAKGYTNVEIAAQLNCSLGSVRAVLMRLYDSTGTCNQASLIYYLMKNKIIK